MQELANGRRILSPFLDAGEACELDATPLHDWSRGALLGRSAHAFLAMDTLDHLREWSIWSSTPVAGACAALLDGNPALGASAVALMPAPDEWIGAALVAAIDADEAFADAPDLQGTPLETGALARTADHPLVAAAIAAWGRGFGARLVARLVESARLLDSIEPAGGSTRPLDFGAAATGADAAIAWVQTARGLLVHRVRLAGDRIAGYRIVAPTEWNFHPRGAFASGASGLDASDARALEADVRRLVATLDPCVGVRYEAAHA